MIAHAILGPGARDSDLRLLRSTGLTIHASRAFTSIDDVSLFIVLGGDGTIHRFLPELARSSKPVLVVPCGSGNDLARALGIRSAAAATTLARDFVNGNAAIRQIDIGIITDSAGKETPFCCTAGIGLDAAAGEFANRMPRWLRARGGYLIAAMNGILMNPKLELTLTAGDVGLAERIEQAACLFTIANTPSFGGGLRIAPDASLDDSQFDCILAEAMTKTRLARASLSLLRGTHLGLPEVHFMRMTSVRIKSSPPANIYADGEFVCETSCEVRIAAGALRVLSLGTGSSK
ncbi:MAG TPA: diacylglycerol kinase family protein [Terriglobales bacterium]|nr:diacylglycerol kinase family protein [Terriglobales bacterium]